MAEAIGLEAIGGLKARAIEALHPEKLREDVDTVEATGF